MLEDDELDEMAQLTQLSERVLTEAYSPQGINVGMNLGRPAGAGIVDHLHMHLVPRWNGDTNFMTVVGDVRVLPEELPRPRSGCGRSSAAAGRCHRRDRTCHTVSTRRRLQPADGSRDIAIEYHRSLIGLSARRPIPA